MKHPLHHDSAQCVALTLSSALASCLLVLPLPARPQTAAPNLKTQAVLPHVDADHDKAPWTAPVKYGVHATTNEHLGLAERASLDAAFTARRGRRGAGTSDPSKVAREPRTPHMDNGKPARAHFQIDTPGDGNIWVFGGSYKARFGSDGASYVPFLGSDVPRNFPVTLSLDSVTSGGATLRFERATAPALEGDSVVYQRGSLRERYSVALGRVEQSFVFETLPSAGALVLELDVVSELSGHETDAGLSFVGDFGRVDYSGAIAIDAQGRRIALATALVDGNVRIEVPAEFVSLAALPLVIDPVITTWAPNSGTTSDFSADIAYDASQNRFLVVYERAFSVTDHDVWGELFSPSTGAAIAGSGAYVDFTGDNWSTPRCANNRLASQFLVVAERTGTPSEIWGRTREAEDTTQGAQFQVSVAGGSGDKQYPDVGGDPELTGPTYYCVVWERTFSVGVDHDVHARLVRTNSTLLGTSVVPIDNSGGSYDRFPVISKHDGLAPFATQAWNVTWNRQFNAMDWDVRGAQVLWNGALITPSFSIDFSGTDHIFPEVSTSITPTADGRPYVATYEAFLPSRSEVIVTALTGSSYLAGTNLSLTLGTGAGISDILPAVETDGNHFAVTWSQEFVPGGSDLDVYACGLYYVGSSIYPSELGTNLAFSSSWEGDVHITALYGAGYTSTWLGAVWTEVAGTYNVEAATYALPVGFGPFIGARYCSPAVPNSSGFSGRIEAQGAGYAGGNPLRLVATQLPLNVFCYFLASPATAFNTTPATSGIVCVGNPLSRFNGSGQVGNTGGTGGIVLDIDTNSIPLPSGGTLAIGAGTTFHFQAWYRDGATNNLTDGVGVLFR